MWDVDSAGVGRRWLKPCSKVTWSGNLLRDNSFVVTGQEKVKFTVRNPSIVAWDDDAWPAKGRLKKVQFEYRLHGCVGPTCWKPSTNTLTFKGKRSITDDWTPPAEDGRYDIRAVTLCNPTGNTEYDMDQTLSISGTIDRNPPELVMLSSSSQAKSVGHHDKVTAVCHWVIRPIRP